MYKVKASKLFTAGLNKVELMTQITPTNGTSYIYHKVIELSLGDLQEGDQVILLSAEAQVSSKMPYNVMVSSVVTIGPSTFNGLTAASSLTFGPYELTEANGTNISNQIHHHPVRRTGAFIVPTHMFDAKLRFLVYAAASSYDGVSKLTIDQDYGRCDAIVLRDIVSNGIYIA